MSAAAITVAPMLLSPTLRPLIPYGLFLLAVGKLNTHFYPCIALLFLCYFATLHYLLDAFQGLNDI